MVLMSDQPISAARRGPPWWVGLLVLLVVLPILVSLPFLLGGLPGPARPTALLLTATPTVAVSPTLTETPQPAPTATALPATALPSPTATPGSPPESPTA